MSLHSKNKLAARLLGSKKFRDAFVSSRLSQLIAMQVKVLRENTGWTQAGLAKELGTSQNAVYRLENPQYGTQSSSTLAKAASVFDVGLVVRFEPYSKMMNWVLSMDDTPVFVPSPANDRILIANASMKPQNNVASIADSPSHKGIRTERKAWMVRGIEDAKGGIGSAELQPPQAALGTLGPETIDHFRHSKEVYGWQAL